MNRTKAWLTRCAWIGFACMLLMRPLHAFEATRGATRPSVCLQQVFFGPAGATTSLHEVRLRWPAHSCPSGQSFRITLSADPDGQSVAFARNVTVPAGKNGELVLNPLTEGLSPDRTYTAKIQPGNLNFNLRISLPPRKPSPLRPGYLDQAWEVAGRAELASYSGIHWNAARAAWERDAQWEATHADDIVDQAYSAAGPALAGLALAIGKNDFGRLDELAKFYNAYRVRFRTIGSLRALAASHGYDARLEGPDSARTLFRKRISDGVTYIEDEIISLTQFYYPIARLLRVITELPSQHMTREMRDFIEAYAPMLLRDHLIRYGYVFDANNWSESPLPERLVDIWRYLATTQIAPLRPHDHAMWDRDLWLIASAAELMGAVKAHPALMRMSPGERGQLEVMVGNGIKLLGRKTTLGSALDFHNHGVTTAIYFQGDLDDTEDMKYAGYAGTAYPAGMPLAPPVNGSWDISHFQRVPVVLRALYDNRRAIGADFPKTEDLQRVIRQYVYNVFNRDFTRPLFKNFFDGNDGWYRVGFHPEHTPTCGYPPSALCDQTDQTRNFHCLGAGAVQGWGLLAFAHPDLLTLQDKFLELSQTGQVADRAFMAQYYKDLFSGTAAEPLFPYLLFAIAAPLAPRY